MFYPIIENGGSIPTKNMRLSTQASVDPSRQNVQVTLPIGFSLGQKQSIDLGHLPDAGPADPETILIENEALERTGQPSRLIRTVLGPHVTQSLGGFGVPIDETKRRIQDGERVFILRAIHYEDIFGGSQQRASKYCFAIGFSISETGELNSAIGPCPHWNCADDECKSDKTAYETETRGWTQPAFMSLPPSPPPYPPQPRPETPQ